jgi:transcriptional regulator GlxA family with amidase domain
VTALIQARSLAGSLKPAHGVNVMPPDPRITWIVDRMHREVARSLSVGRLSALVNLSPSRFRSLFMAQTGVPPLRYLQRLRLRRARILVLHTFLSIKEVMALVGYNDPSHFARDFRREHGAPPIAFRSGRIGGTRAREI